jgi:AcrR family transcriptional regulator
LSITYVRAVTIALKTSKGLQRREQIIAVARKLLVEEGYDRFVLREIGV